MTAVPRSSGGIGPALEVTDLKVAFADRRGGVRIILDVPAFNVVGGTQIALCGPSGSGKTTFLNLLAGLQQGGAIRWASVDLSSLSQRELDRWRRQSAGLVFQQFHLFPGLSALENVLLPLRFDKWALTDDAKRRAILLLDRVGVARQGDLRTLSRGELQRIAVVRALMRSPAIVLADEPTASLDVETGRALANLLCTLCREAGTTLIATTHDRALAERFDGVHEIVGCRLQRRARRATAIDEDAVA